MKATMLRCLLALAVGLLLLLTTGVIDTTGAAFSPSPYHRWQVLAFLKGEMALSQYPQALAHDLVWSQGGVHQVWGLGVPAWRLPWEALTKVLAGAVCPDYLPLAIAIALLINAAWCFIPDAAANRGDRRAVWLRCGIVVLIVAFPPFISLLMSRFAVYEEVAAYAYIACSLLGILLVRFATAPSGWRLIGIAALCGFVPHVRPTLSAYAIVTMGMALYIWRRFLAERHARPYSAPRSVTALALFTCGALWLLLYVTNYCRFGDGLEFGHRLNLQASNLHGSLFATHFGVYPFQNVSNFIALRELFGAMFFVRKFNNADWYAEDLFLGQSETLRFREFYFTTYTGITLLLLCLAIALLATDYLLGRKPSTIVRIVFMWSALCLLPLIAFYSYTPCITSRYLMDMAPAICGLLTAGWIRLWEVSAIRRGGVAPIMWLISLLSIQTLCIAQTDSFDEGPTPVHRDAVPLPPKGGTISIPIEAYERRAQCDGTSIPFNGSGWGIGEVASVVTLFASNISTVEVEMSRLEETTETINAPFVRVDGTILPYIASRSGTNTIQYRYGSAPLKKAPVLSVVFIGFGPDSKLNMIKTNASLRAVRFRLSE